MEATTVIRRPIITEKATFAHELNRYAFEIDRRATKSDVKRAVEELYGVRVVGVATQNRKGRLRRNRHGFWQAKRMKRAVVRVHADDRIDLF